MVERESPLDPVLRSGGRSGDDCVTLSEVTPHFIAEVAAWAGQKDALAAAVADVTGLALAPTPNAGAADGDTATFSIAPERFLVATRADLAASLAEAIPIGIGTVTDLSHGRTAIRIAGPRAEWVLSKLFAIDFSLAAFPVTDGRATAHHDIFAQIQRTGETQFDIYVFRSFARAFWNTLCDAAEEVGYEVA